jgi:hypothetical protein
MEDEMRLIEIEEGVTIRFPTRSDDFAEGFEAGMAAAALAALPLRHNARVATGAVPAIAKLARCYGYRVVQGPEEDGMVYLTLLRADTRPRLTVVHTSEPATASK